MVSPPQEETASLVASERVLLRFLCARDAPGPSVTEIVRVLEGYRFRDAENEVILRALLEFGDRNEKYLESQLASHLTRLGFPDLDLESLFVNPAPAAVEVRLAMDRISAARPAKA